MKRFVLVIALLCAITSPLSAQTPVKDGFWKTLGKKIHSSLPVASSPLLKQFGVGATLGPAGAHVSGTNWVIKNRTPHWGKIMAYGTVLQEEDPVGALVPVKLEPWGSITDTRQYEPVQNAEIPILIKFYEDRELTKYIGATVFPLRSYGGGYDDSVVLTIDASML